MAEAPQPGSRRSRPRQRKAVERVSDPSFPLVMRGYDRHKVDRYVAEVTQLVVELEARQLRETVVQSALDEVGEQTSSILQRAHEAADELEAKSRSQADGRLQRAEREAEDVRREAEHHAEALAADTHALWLERQRLIEEMRLLADEVLGVADEALERVSEPGTALTAEDEDEDEVELDDPEESSPFGDEDTTAAEIEALSQTRAASGNGSDEPGRPAPADRD